MLTYLVKRNRYVSAKEVFDYMNQEFKGVSYDTIYRNLHDFAEIDLLEETDLNGEMKFRFHCCQGKSAITIILSVQCAEQRKKSICVR